MTNINNKNSENNSSIIYKNDSNIIIDDLIIIKTLGYGMVGTVYKTEYKKKFYALKVEHILETDLKYNPKSVVWREINFCVNFALKYPDQFTNLLVYDFIDNCTHKQKYSFPIKTFPLKAQENFIKLKNSNWCIRKVFELIDGSLDSVLGDLNIKQIYSMIVQLCWIIKLLESNGYIHGDIHSGNIGFIQTKSKYINIWNQKIPTYGYIFKLIDYGLVAHKSDKLNIWEKENIKYLFTNGEVTSIIHLLFDNQKFWNWVNKNKIKYNDYKTDLKAFNKTPEKKYIKKITSNKDLQFLLFQIMYPEQYQKLALGNNFIKTIEPKIYTDLIDIILIIQNTKNIDLISKYFIIKLKEFV